jgi:hypothetical protein
MTPDARPQSLARIFPSAWVGRAIRPSRRATGLAEYGGESMSIREPRLIASCRLPFRSASRRPGQAGRLSYPSGFGNGYEISRLNVLVALPKF